MAADVVFVGGGVIGLAGAWRCAVAGLRVTVVDPAPGRGASWVAAGMLAPVTEATFGEEHLTRLLVAAARRGAGCSPPPSPASGARGGCPARGTGVGAARRAPPAGCGPPLP